MRSTDLSRRAIVLGCASPLLGAAPPPDDIIAVENDAGRCIVPVILDGRPARMLLDTGAERSVIAHATAVRLGLRPDSWVATTMRGAEGLLERFANIDVARAHAGDVPLVQNAPGAGVSLAVTTADLGDADGLLGGDILRHFTVDLDMPQARLWLRPAAAKLSGGGPVPLQMLRRDLLLAPLRLGGHDLVALLDTGASSSLLNARGLFRIGMLTAQALHDPVVAVRALGGTSMARLHHFADLRIGTLSMPAPTLLIEPVPEPAYDVVLGLDILGQQRIELSYLSRTLRFVARAKDR